VADGLKAMEYDKGLKSQGLAIKNENEES